MPTDPTEQPDPAEETPRRRPFAAYLQQTNGGRTHEECTEALHTATAAVEETGKKAVLQITITINPTKGNHLNVVEQVVTKLPRPDAHQSVFWVDAEGNLVDRDPDQLAFGDIRPAPATTIRTIERNAQ